MASPPDQKREPVDADVDLTIPAQRREFDREHLAVIAAVAVGGGIGAAARHGAAVAWPVQPGSFPTTTLLVNLVGCALIGVLIVAITEARSAHRLTRPFLGTGVLGGFTTFSAWALEIQTLIEDGHVRIALSYLLITLVTGLAAAWIGSTLTRRLIAWRRHR